MPTANCEWNIRTVESQEIPGQFFADAISPGRFRAVETAPGITKMVPVRLFTKWHNSRTKANADIDWAISRYESGCP